MLPGFFTKAGDYAQRTDNGKTGADTAVLLIHGIVGTPYHFRDLLPVVPETWSVYHLLMDGHGGSVEKFARTSMEKRKAQVNRRVKEILEESVHCAYSAAGTQRMRKALRDCAERCF